MNKKDHESMGALSFKRAKKIIALHYGVATYNTRKLCKLFPTEPGKNKSELITTEAARILASNRYVHSWVYPCKCR